MHNIQLIIFFLLNTVCAKSLFANDTLYHCIGNDKQIMNIVDYKGDTIVSYHSKIQNGSLVPDEKNIYSYDNDGNNIVRTSYIYIGGWVKYNTRYKKYNDEGMELQDSLVYYNSGDSTIVVPYYKIDKRYNAEQQLTYRQFTKWNESTQVWVVVTQKEYTYSNNRLVEYRLFFNYSDTINDLYERSRRVYTYNQAGLLSEEVLTNNLGEQGRYIYNYTDFDSLQTIYQYYRADSTAAWEKAYIDTFLFNNNHYKTKQYNYVWFDYWKLYEKTTWKYADHQLIEFMEQQNTTDITDTSEVLEVVSRTTYFVDETDSVVIWYVGDPDYWIPTNKKHYSYENNMLKSINSYGYNFSQGEWYEQDFSIYNIEMSCIEYKHELSTGANEFEIQDLKIYPNPAHDQLTIETQLTRYNNAHVEIYDLQGKLIDRKAITQTVATIDISNLYKGVYICKLVADGEQLSTERLVKL